jgi:branched-chain amino acid transport system substrate-binding protein
MKKVGGLSLALLFAMTFAFGLLPSQVQAAASQQPVVIGVLMDASGGAAFYSGQRVMGAEAAVEEINKAGGIMGRPVKLVKQDDANNPNVAPIRTRALIEAGASGVLMTSGSASTLQARVVLEEMKVPGLTENMNPKIIQPPNNSYIFLTGNDTNQIAQVLTEAVKPYKRLAIFTDNSPTGMGLANSFKDVFEKDGVKVMMMEAVDVGATDATAQVSRMKSQKVDAVFITGQASPEQALFLRTAEMQGLDVPMYQDITASSPQYWKLAGAPALKNLRYVAQYDPANQSSARVWKTVVDKYGSKAQDAALCLQTWDDIYLLKRAIESAKSTNGAAVREALEKISNFPTNWGQTGSTLSCGKDNHRCSTLKGLLLRGFVNGVPGPAVQKF